MKVCSIFSQVLKLFSRGGFEKAVKQHKAERHARGFTSWGQFIAMLFCQVGRAHSLREICGGLACSWLRTSSATFIKENLRHYSLVLMAQQ
jgi:hypothetical protein